MQLTIRFNDTDSVTFAVKVQNVGDDKSNYVPEVVSATITDKKLSSASVDDILDVTGQVLDHMAGPLPEYEEPPKDWREGWAD